MCPTVTWARVSRLSFENFLRAMNVDKRLIQLTLNEEECAAQVKVFNHQRLCNIFYYRNRAIQDDFVIFLNNNVLVVRCENEMRILPGEHRLCNRWISTACGLPTLRPQSLLTPVARKRSDRNGVYRTSNHRH